MEKGFSRPIEGGSFPTDWAGIMSGSDDLTAFFRRIPVALYRSGIDGSLLEANDALAHLLGYESVEQLKRGLDSVERVYVDPGQRLKWVETISQAGVVYDFDIEMRRTDGTTVWVQDTAVAVKDEQGEILYFEGVIVDVTEKVKVRKAKDELMATVSHELRNPIAVIFGLSEEMAQNFDSFSDEDKREMAALIARQADDAAWLIEDLLVAYRDDGSQVSVVPQSFEAIKEVERVIEVIEPPITVEVRGMNPRVMADPRRTRQILRNLVSNAQRYGGEEVTICVEPSGDRIELQVCDNGEPIDQSEIERIFQPFESGTKATDSRSVGLGLAVARRLARLMGGDLVYRHDGQYSRFVLSLPVG